MAEVEVPWTLEYRGGQLNAALVLEVENFTNYKKRFMCHILGIEPQFENIIKNGPFIPMTAGQRMLEGQWTLDERKFANLDQRLKSLIMSVHPDDQMNSVINCLTAKSTWDDLILYQEGPYNRKERKNKPELRPIKNFKAKYNKVKAKLALLSSSASGSKAATIKNKGLIAEAYEWDEEEVSLDDNEMVKVKVLMALAEENDAVSKEGARNGEWVKISMRKCISEQIPSQKKRILGADQLTKDPSSFGLKDLVFVKSSADDKKVSIHGVERPWLSEVKGLILPNHDTGRILLTESQRNTTDPPVAVTDSLVTNYDSADESSVYSTPLPPLKKLDGAEPIFGPKTIKSNLKSKSTFKYETLKGVIINESSSAPAKDNKSSSASKVNSAPVGQLKSVKIKDDPPLAICDIRKPICSGKSSTVASSVNISSGKIYTNSGKRTIAVRMNMTNSGNVDKPCSSCEKGKHHRASFKTKQTFSIMKCLHLLHMYLFGPVTPRSINHEKHTLIIVDDYSRYTWVYFLKKKSQAPETIMSFIKRVENQNDIKVKQLKTDNVYIHNHKDHLGKFDEKADDDYLLGYSLVSKAFRVFNNRGQQTEETYHITFDESPDAIKFLNL
ncbi:retrovirus-related pol polyprotein from transposon TNT 1-94 [Tanacetum coccineum]